MLTRAALALLLTLPLVAAIGCGPDKFQCTGPRESFKVLLRLADRELPEDTVVVVMYGGSSTERYRLTVGDVGHEVVFCTPADAQGNELTLPDAGAVSSAEALSCKLWTGGYTKLQVLGTGIAPTEYDLLPHEDRCTVLQTIELATGDAG